MSYHTSSSRERLGSLILMIGFMLPLIMDGLLTVGGMLLLMYSIVSWDPNALVDPAGFGMTIGLLLLLPGISILLLLYLSRLGPRSR